MSGVRTHFWVENRRRPAACGAPSRLGTKGCMPAVVNKTVGSSLAGISDALGTSAWLWAVKNWRNIARSSALVGVFMRASVTARAGLGQVGVDFWFFLCKSKGRFLFSHMSEITVPAGGNPFDFIKAEQPAVIEAVQRNLGQGKNTLSPGDAFALMVRKIDGWKNMTPEMVEQHQGELLQACQQYARAEKNVTSHGSLAFLALSASTLIGQYANISPTFLAPSIILGFIGTVFVLSRNTHLTKKKMLAVLAEVEAAETAETEGDQPN